MGCSGSKAQPKRSSSETSADVSLKGSSSNSLSVIGKPRNVVLVGNVGVGKTSLMYRYAFDLWSQDEAELKSKVVVDKDYVTKKVQIGNVEETLHIWDTGGQERYATMTQSYYRGADCCILVYDKTNKASYEDIEKWCHELDRYTKPYTPRILVGNKKDVSPEVISTQDGEKLRRLINADFFIEVSAKNGEEVSKIFTAWLTKK